MLDLNRRVLCDARLFVDASGDEPKDTVCLEKLHIVWVGRGQVALAVDAFRRYLNVDVEVVRQTHSQDLLVINNDLLHNNKPARVQMPQSEVHPAAFGRFIRAVAGVLADTAPT